MFDYVSRETSLSTRKRKLCLDMFLKFCWAYKPKKTKMEIRKQHHPLTKNKNDFMF